MQWKKEVKKTTRPRSRYGGEEEREGKPWDSLLSQSWSGTLGRIRCLMLALLVQLDDVGGLLCLRTCDVFSGKKDAEGAMCDHEKPPKD